MISRPSKPRRQQGVALVIAMLVFALATTMVVAMSSEFTLFLKRGGNMFIAQQGFAYLRGGEELAGLALQQDLQDDQKNQEIRDDLSEIWAQQVPPYALDEGGWLVGTLEDLDGRFNLNSVAGKAPEGKRYTAAQEQFIRLLQIPEEPRMSEQDAVLVTESLMDWLDPDSDPRDSGAEDDYYADMSPSYRAANNRLYTVSELRLVANMTPAMYTAIAPYVSVWGPGTSINVHTASIVVLRTINTAGDLSPLSLAEGESLLELREELGFESLQAMLDSPTFTNHEIAPALQARLGEVSSWFLYRGEVEVADRKSRLYSVLRRTDGQVQAVVRSSGEF
jgi:general secretion pathway protein K